MASHYRWQTRHPVVGEHERRLVEHAFLPLEKRILDVGCGEGATLYHLGAPPGAVGLDLFEDKLAFARAELPACRFVRGSVYELPFEAQSFDQVIVRDVIHHLDDPPRALDEVRRVLAPGGRVDVLEPVGKNPLVFLHAVTNKAERGELRSTPAFLERLVASRFTVLSCEALQPLPLHRAVFHEKIGSPRLGESPLARRTVGALERLAARLMPRALWAYYHVRAKR